MKQAMINYMQMKKNDELYTPNEAIYPILKYLDKDKIYWECTDFGDSNIRKVLVENGFKVIATRKEEFNFLKDEPLFKFDVIITNPPYSIKDKFIKRCYELDKPFLLLLPLTALEGKERNKLYKEKGIELIILNKRINFMKNKNNVWFNTSWFCRGITDKQLNFEEVQ
jgi:23S rRNA G2445 N2-methylase RlmL